MNTFRMQVFSENGQAKSGISQRHRKELPAFNQNDNENEKDMIYEMNKKNAPKQDGLNARNTFLMEKWHTKYVMKEVHDTTYISKTDSVHTPYPVEVINEVEKPLTWWQQTKMHVGAIVIFGLLIALFINIFIRIFKKYFLP